MTDTEQQRQTQNDSHGDQGRPARQHQRPDRDEPIMVKRGETGTVKWFSFKSGYGFIQIDNSDDEVFVHSSSIVTLRKVFCVLHDGDQVEFDVIQGLKGLEAVAVTGVGGKKIGGARFNERRPPMQQQQQGGEKNGSGGGGGAGGAGKGRRRRTTSQENNNNEEDVKQQGEENGGGDAAEGGARKQNGGRGPRTRGPRGGGGKRTGGSGSGEKFVDAKQSPDGDN